MRACPVLRYLGSSAKLFGIALMATSFSHVARAEDLKMQKSDIPHVQRTGSVTQLVAGGKPFLALGGELGNSTASDLNVLDSALARCHRMGLNTVMLPVYWDLTEQEEGKFDFSLEHKGFRS